MFFHFRRMAKNQDNYKPKLPLELKHYHETSLNIAREDSYSAMPFSASNDGFAIGA